MRSTLSMTPLRDVEHHFPSFKNQSMGPREHEGSLQSGLERGHRFGFIASSDNHIGVPGYWGSGLMGVYARDLTRESLWEAFLARRTYGVTGDHIRLEFSLVDTAFMGEEIELSRRDLSPLFHVSVEGSHRIDRIDLVKNNRLIQSYIHYDRESKRENVVCFKLRLEFGFGPEEYLERQWNEWQGSLKISSGKILGIERAYTWIGQKVERIDTQEYTWRLKTKARTYSQQLIFTIEAPRSALISIESNGKGVQLPVEKALKEPTVIAYIDEAKKMIEKEFGLQAEKIENPDHFYHHAFKLKIQRAILQEDYMVETFFKDESITNKRDNWYYVRVYQRNGQMAWSSPIWVHS